MLGDDAALVQEGVAAHEIRALADLGLVAEELDLRALARSEALAHRQQIVDRGPQALDAIAAQRRHLPGRYPIGKLTALALLAVGRAAAGS